MAGRRCSTPRAWRRAPRSGTAPARCAGGPGRSRRLAASRRNDDAKDEVQAHHRRDGRPSPTLAVAEARRVPPTPGAALAPAGHGGVGPAGRGGRRAGSSPAAPGGAGRGPDPDPPRRGDAGRRRPGWSACTTPTPGRSPRAAWASRWSSATRPRSSTTPTGSCSTTACMVGNPPDAPLLVPADRPHPDACSVGSRGRSTADRGYGEAKIEQRAARPRRHDRGASPARASPAPPGARSSAAAGSAGWSSGAPAARAASPTSSAATRWDRTLLDGLGRRPDLVRARRPGPQLRQDLHAHRRQRVASVRHPNPTSTAIAGSRRPASRATTKVTVRLKGSPASPGAASLLRGGEDRPEGSRRAPG